MRIRKSMADISEEIRVSKEYERKRERVVEMRSNMQQFAEAANKVGVELTKMVAALRDAVDGFDISKIVAALPDSEVTFEERERRAMAAWRKRLEQEHRAGIAFVKQYADHVRTEIGLPKIHYI